MLIINLTLIILTGLMGVISFLGTLLFVVNLFLDIFKHDFNMIVPGCLVICILGGSYVGYSEMFQLHLNKFIDTVNKTELTQNKNVNG